MRFQLTVRYGTRYQRYHTFVVEADDARDALLRAGEKIPAEIAAEADLVELRVAADAEERTYLGEDEES